jgi:hypothetical protein
MNSLTVRVFSNFTVTNTSELLGRSEDEFSRLGIRLIFNRSGKADLVIVLNAVTTPRWVSVPRGNLIKVLQEPAIENPWTHLFTYWHSKIFDRILTHTPALDDPRQVRSLPCTGSFVDPTTFTEQPFDLKKQPLSIVASTLAILPGHKVRLNFVTELLSRFPGLTLHTFGKGREKELKQKIDGLRDYRFSIAIENSCIPSYITEKFYDCILAGSVPLYYGAPNVSDYFPIDSYIPLPIDNFEECCRIISELSESDYKRRLPSLVEAKSLIRDKYSIGAVILNHFAQTEEPNSSKKRFVFLLRLDGIICFAQKTGITTVPKRFYSLMSNFIQK